MLNRLRRFAFRLLYNECAFAYDLISRVVSLGRWRSWQRVAMSFLPPPEAGLHLELAHGTGNLQQDLLKAGYSTVALDRSRNMGKIAQQNLARVALRTALLQAEAGRLPIQSNSIAGIVCTFPTAFIVEPQTLIEIQRVLKPGASAVIVLSGLLTGGGLATWLIRCLYRLCGQAYRASTEAELRSLFEAAGLKTAALSAPVDGSVVQIVHLTKAGKPANDVQNHSLDMGRQS